MQGHRLTTTAFTSVASAATAATASRTMPQPGRRRVPTRVPQALRGHVKQICQLIGRERIHLFSIGARNAARANPMPVKNNTVARRVIATCADFHGGMFRLGRRSTIRVRTSKPAPIRLYLPLGVLFHWPRFTVKIQTNVDPMMMMPPTNRAESPYGGFIVIPQLQPSSAVPPFRTRIPTGVPLGRGSHLPTLGSRV